MITVKEAQKIILENTSQLNTEMIHLSQGLGRILAKDIKSPIALPVDDNSAMDGYVLNSKACYLASESRPVQLKVKKPIKAGDNPKKKLKLNEAYPIMTGAVIPQGGDTILIKEHAIRRNGELIVRKKLPKGKHIRRKAEEIKKGQTVLAQNKIITPALVGFMASLGIKKIPVYRAPKITVIVTGSELVSLGKTLTKGKIYDSNSHMMKSLLEEMGLGSIQIKRVKDNMAAITKVTQKALSDSELILFMGGVSVGDYDFVKDVLNKEKVKTLFWKIKQKPGKPLYFGKKKQTLVFGLPGNPASVFTCFYEYVYPALRKMMRRESIYLQKETVSLTQEIKVDLEKTKFLKANIVLNTKKREVSPLSNQGSHMLSSLCEANGLVVIPPGRKTLKKGNKVEVHLFPKEL